MSSGAAEHRRVSTEHGRLMRRLRGRADAERTPIPVVDLAADPLEAADISAAASPPSAAILEVRDLSVEYLLESAVVNAVDHVSLALDRGEFLAVVGESGSGKSTLLFGIAQLLSPPAEITSGSVVFRGRNMVRLTDSALAAIRWKDLSVVMQSAMNALNPVKSIGAQFKDAMRAHGTT